MSKRRRTANSSEPVSYYIPVVLIYDILSWLPVKSLIRFQTVCKAWYHLIIKNPNFIQTHNSMQSTLQHEPSFTAMLLEIGNRMKFCYGDDAFHKLFDLQLPNLFMHNFHVVGICDGLVCATEAPPDSSEYIIFNPTTRKFRKIYPFKLPVFEHDVFYLWFGLFENEYKLLKLILTWFTEDAVIRGELYCLCNDSWQEFEVNLGGTDPIFYNGHIGPNPRQPLMLGGVLFWKDEISNVDSCVAYFDMHKKVFDLIDLPFNIYFCTGSELLEVNHKLGLVFTEEGSHIEFWLLDENMKGFTKIHTVACLTCSGYPPNRQGYRHLVGCSRKGEVIIEDVYENNYMLLLYDLASNEMKYLRDADLERECRGSSWKYGSVYPYNASLTHVD